MFGLGLYRGGAAFWRKLRPERSELELGPSPRDGAASPADGPLGPLARESARALRKRPSFRVAAQRMTARFFGVNQEIATLQPLMEAQETAARWKAVWEFVS